MSASFPDAATAGGKFPIAREQAGTATAPGRTGTDGHPAAFRAELKPGKPSTLPTLRDLREEVFSRAECIYLHNLVRLTGHDIRKACELSGLSRSRLYCLLRKYRIDQ